MLAIAYKITHKTNGRTYIGATLDLDGSLFKHMEAKKTSINQYEVTIIRICKNIEEANLWEENYVDEAKANGIPMMKEINEVAFRENVSGTAVKVLTPWNTVLYFKHRNMLITFLMENDIMFATMKRNDISCRISQIVSTSDQNKYKKSVYGWRFFGPDADVIYNEDLPKKSYKMTKGVPKCYVTLEEGMSLDAININHRLGRCECNE